MSRLHEELLDLKYDLIEEVEEKAPDEKTKKALIEAIQKMNVARMYRKHVANGYSGLDFSVIKYLKQIKEFESWDPYDVDWLLRDIVLEVIVCD